VGFIQLFASTYAQAKVYEVRKHFGANSGLQMSFVPVCAQPGSPVILSGENRFAGEADFGVEGPLPSSQYSVIVGFIQLFAFVSISDQTA
jgi:hypothetical protein